MPAEPGQVDAVAECPLRVQEAAVAPRRRRRPRDRSHRAARSPSCTQAARLSRHGRGAQRSMMSSARASRRSRRPGGRYLPPRWGRRDWRCSPGSARQARRPMLALRHDKRLAGVVGDCAFVAQLVVERDAVWLSKWKTACRRSIGFMSLYSTEVLVVQRSAGIQDAECRCTRYNDTRRIDAAYGMAHRIATLVSCILP